MKKLLTILSLLLLCLCLLCACTVGMVNGGTDNSDDTQNDSSNNSDDSTQEETIPMHTCVFDQKNEDDAFLKNPASCSQRKTYYYSCTCGQMGSEFFSVGGYGHVLVEGKCANCDYHESVGLVFDLYHDSMEYKVTDLGTCTDQHVIIPAYYNDLPVTKVSINEMNGSNVEALTIPETVTDLNFSERYDYYYRLTRLYFQGDLNQWMNLSLANNGLTSCISGVEVYIDGRLITDLVIPEGVTEINRYAFQNWNWLQSISIPASVTTIDDYAFIGCNNNLKRISVDEGNEIYRSAGNCLIKEDTVLRGCNTSTIPDDGSVTKIGAYAFENCDGLKNLTLPSSVMSIASSAFKQCDGLESVVGSGVIEVDGYSFYDCDVLRHYAFSENCAIQEYSFAYCPNLTSTPDTETDTVQIGDYLFRMVEEVPTLVGYVGTESVLTLPADYQGSAYVIGEKAFYNNDKLYKLVIPDTVTAIGEEAFANCDFLFNVTLGSGLTSIASNAFVESYRLVEVYNRSSLNVDISTYGLAQAINIYDYADGSYLHFTEDGYVFYLHFYHSYLLGYIGSDANLELPSAVPSPSSGLQSNQAKLYYSVHDYAFYQCASIASVNIPARAAFLGKYAFSECESLKKVEFSGDVMGLGDYAFADCPELIVLNLPASVANVGKDAFDFESLRALYFDGDIDDWAKINFSSRILLDTSYQRNQYPEDKVYINGLRVKSYQTLIFSDDVSIIGSNAFADWDWVRKVDTGSGVQSIGEFAFGHCYYMQTVIIGPKVLTIYDEAFNSCENLAHVIDLAGLNITKDSSENGSVGRNAAVVSRQAPIVKGDFTFVVDTDGLYYLIEYTGTKVDVVLPDDCNGNDYTLLQAFRDKPITSIHIGVGVIEIGTHAFHAFRSSSHTLKTVTFATDSKLTAIGNQSFSFCSYLTTIDLPSGVTSIASNAFYQCSILTSLTIPSSVTFIGQEAFYGCSSELLQKEDGVYYVDKWAVSSDSNYDTPDNTNYTLRSDTVGISSCAFRWCTYLKNISIPCSITTIGDHAFSDLSSITFDGTIEQWNEVEKSYDWVANRSSDGVIVCIDGTVAIYENIS